MYMYVHYNEGNENVEGSMGSTTDFGKFPISVVANELL